MAWIMVAKCNPNLKFYLGILQVNTPENFYLTASYGGKFDHLIDEGSGIPVVNSVEDADTLGLPVDVDERHCFTPGPFAILLHGTQPKGSEAGKAARINRTVKKELTLVDNRRIDLQVDA